MLDAFRHDAFLVGLRVMGFEPTGEGQAALKAKIAADSAKMAKVIADLGTPKR